jgi:hypothetical protein
MKDAEARLEEVERRIEALSTSIVGMLREMRHRAEASVQLVRAYREKWKRRG